MTDALNNLITVDGEAVPIVGEEAAGENTEQTEVVQAEGTENVEGENTEELTDELTQYATDVRFTINAVYYSALDEAEADN